MRYRREGQTTSDTGLVGISHRIFLRNVSLIDHLEAVFVVRRLEATECPTNSGNTGVRAVVIDLNKFNDGSPGGGLTGDHFIRLYVNREADSTEPIFDRETYYLPDLQRRQRFPSLWDGTIQMRAT